MTVFFAKVADVVHCAQSEAMVADESVEMFGVVCHAVGLYQPQLSGFRPCVALAAHIVQDRPPLLNAFFE